VFSKSSVSEVPTLVSEFSVDASEAGGIAKKIASARLMKASNER